MVPCHHSTTHPQEKDWKDSLQTWTVTSNIIHKGYRQLRRSNPPLGGWARGLQLLTMKQNWMKFRTRNVKALYQDKYILMSHQESLGHNHNIKIPDIKKSELYSEKIKCTLHLKGACNNSVHNLLSFYWLFKNTKAKLHRTVILLLIFNICQTCP